MNILLADNQEIFLDGVKSLIHQSTELKVIGEAKSGKEVLAMVKERDVKVLVMDIAINDINGLETARYINENHKDINVLLLSSQVQQEEAMKMLKVDAHGYIIKNSGKEQLLYAIKKVGCGEKFICSDMALLLLNKLKQSEFEDINFGKPEPPELSKRELEVLQLISEGFTNNEIADKLFTSRRTVETHRKNLIEKTGVKNTASLIKYAAYHRIIK